MTLVLKPKGRGNWRALRIQVLDTSPRTHLPIMAVRVGELVTLGRVVFRICKVMP